MQVAGWQFDLLTWEIHALREKIGADMTHPARALLPTIATEQVLDYLAQARQIVDLENQINKIYSENNNHATAASASLQQTLDQLRQRQNSVRPTVEQIIQNQIARELIKNNLQLYGMPLPPVQFTFVEPPKKLIVSPRDHIETFYGEMVQAEMPLAAIEQTERAIRQQKNLSAYITNIGGLGAFPTMVVDRAGLDWILSTVAHEWTHNYLAFFPLGLSYFSSPDMTTINETVAEIVGNEVGQTALQTFYPTLATPIKSTITNDSAEASQVAVEQPPAFDFDTEMRKTRLMVDQILAAGKVDEAERYMEERRLLFVQHGYPLRVLNQAYFAFNGSYGTSPASTSPIGPKLFLLRHLTPDLKTFLITVRGITQPNDLDAALAHWNRPKREN
ncbi:MAG: hypothetical protein NT075_30835 [Chloroflexi bacterium]|nr:hypothetical protein [Chloroflexota bacterium]